MSKLLFEKESYAIIGACIEVHKKMGNGFSEEVYEEVLQKEFTKREIPFERNKKLELFYNGERLNERIEVSYVCYNNIIVDLKSIGSLSKEIRQQAVNFLKTTNFKLGLLINFGESSLTWKRLINTPVTV